ncbi:MAG: GreA/GreB family elongation factor [Candidatus Altiarchaeota archaeon]
MDTYDVRQIVLDAISKRSPRKCGYYHICWWEERIQCLSPHHTGERHDVFFGAGDDVLSKALSEYQYRLIENRILYFCRGKKITLRPVKSQSKNTCEGGYIRKGKIQVSEFDASRLKTLLVTATSPGCFAEDKLKQLECLLENAKVVTPESMPADAVTMNTKLRLRDYESGEDMVISLVFPADATVPEDFEDMKVSILSSMGLSVFGLRAGQVASGQIRVEEVLYQPEAAGRFDL